MSELFVFAPRLGRKAAVACPSTSCRQRLSSAATFKPGISNSNVGVTGQMVMASTGFTSRKRNPGPDGNDGQECVPYFPHTAFTSTASLSFAHGASIAMPC